MTKGRILVVDDERNMRTTLADILSEEGFDVSTAESGEKAVRMRACACSSTTEMSRFHMTW